MTPAQLCVCGHGPLSHENGTGYCRACRLLVSAPVPGWVECPEYRKAA